MAPQDPVLASLAKLGTKVDHLSAQVAAQEKRLHLVYTVVVLVVGVVGGPNAVQALMGQ
jgi:hypothetical protein